MQLEYAHACLLLDNFAIQYNVFDFVEIYSDGSYTTSLYHLLIGRHNLYGAAACYYLRNGKLRDVEWRIANRLCRVAGPVILYYDQYGELEESYCVDDGKDDGKNVEIYYDSDDTDVKLYKTPVILADQVSK